MIFKNLFRPKHQDPKPAVRITAIGSLSAEVPEQKSILHELAFNDEDVNVSLAALAKLNSFVLWYKMAEIAKNDRIAKRAQQVVESTLFSDDESTMARDEKLAFAYECKNNKLLERLLKQSWVQHEPKLVLNILATLNKPQLAMPILLASDDEALQSALLVYADTESSLQKVIKKTRSEQIKAQAQEKLTRIQFSKVQPVEVEKGTRLVLSRLLALKDQRDYAKLVAIRGELSKEYAAFEIQFDCLSSDKREAFNSKYAELDNKLTILDAELAPMYHAQQRKQDVLNNVQHAMADTQAVLVWLSDMVSGDISAVTLAQTEQAQTEIQNRTSRLESLMSDAEKAGMKQAVKQLQDMHHALLTRQHTYNHLPAFQDALKQARALLADFAERTVPNQGTEVENAKSVLQQIKGQWRELRVSYQDSWPKELDSQFASAQGAWQSAIKSLSAGVTQDVNRIRSKTKAIESLIEQGKYKAAMGLFSKVSKWFALLPEQEQARNARIFEQTSLKVEELKSLQAYIALPRKPALIEEAQDLVAANVSVSLRAEQVKELRRRWNSLGVLSTPEDDGLNMQFDVLIEQAFAPCREHFEKQQQQRVDNLVHKQAVLQQIAQLSEQALALDVLAKTVQQIQQKWQAIGDVDFTLKADLNNEYRQALMPLKVQVEAYFSDNALQKQALIKQALALSAAEDISGAIEQAKVLQERWKQVGPAQRKLENPLWNQFREANDSVFAQRKAFNLQQKQADAEQGEIANGLLKQIQQSLKNANTIGELDDAFGVQSELETLLEALPKSLSINFRRRLNALFDERQAKLEVLKRQVKKESFNELFAILKRWESPEIPQNIDVLPAQWQQSFKGQCDVDVPRHNLTLMLELLSDVSSPDSDVALRKEIQLQLMADKLQQGVEYDKYVLLKRWIQHGPVGQQEHALLLRAERCFI
ncbi:DUF349 domain-containing protein [Paraglaciecola polaris]|uniref:DUF349 domain-containing protein n=1 Tax=Paraglaciecola polaris LMG 21857 TaxID=1129793 RepID=K7A7I9_9ALTE|nr:DUF349 domain-containing protein [Paraglaciecola polaris]GAC31425.1 hypothetical protein GPLA_0508 [Paraglaciecola polaris LMG 21857]